MSKLFSFLDSNDFNNVEVAIENNKEDTLDSKIEFEIENIDNLSDGLEYVTEGFKTLSDAFYKVNNTSTLLLENTSSKDDFIASMEQINLLTEYTLKNLGIKTKLPSLEDFRNSYAYENCRLITMESFKDWLVTLWEKIKKFFKDFFNKINYFFRRLLNLNLTLEEYDKVIDNKIKNLKDKSNIESKLVESNLPVYLADEGLTTIDNVYLLTTGKRKIFNLINDINNLDNALKETMLQSVNYSLELSRLLDKENIEESNIKEYIENLKSILTETIFTYKSDLNDDLPLKVYDNFTDRLMNTGDNKEDIISVYKLLDKQDEKNTPCYLNIYLGYNNSKIIVDSKYEENTYAKKEMQTLTKKKDIEDLYDIYKNMKKELKIEDISRNLDKHKNTIDKMIKDVEKLISSKKKVIATTPSINSNKENNIKTLLKIIINNIDNDLIISNNKKEKDGYVIFFIINKNKEIPFIFRKVKDNNLIFIPEEDVMLIANDLFDYDFDQDKIDDLVNNFLNFYNKNRNIINKVLLNSNIVDSDNTVDDLDINNKLKLLDNIALFYISYMNSISEIIQILISKHLTIYTKLKYEIVKYIYKSADNF